LSAEKNRDQCVAVGKRVKSTRNGVPTLPENDGPPPVAYSFFRPKQKSTEEGIR